MSKKFTAKSDAIYLTDNGAAYCGDHLGMTAKMTGRDISGQKVYALTAADAAFWKQHNQAGNPPMCETCRKPFAEVAHV
jgi:hypothetical protein